jgi:hypothetical protein
MTVAEVKKMIANNNSEKAFFNKDWNWTVDYDTNSTHSRHNRLRI